MSFYNYYGIESLTLEEEANLPRYKKTTRNNKIAIIDDCNFMRKMLDSIENRTRKIPEKDDYEHCVMVMEYAKLIHKAMCKIDEACLYKRG